MRWLGETVIWGEVLFCIDFSMDLCALYVMSGLIGWRVRTLRLCVAACICAAVGVLCTAVTGGIRTVCLIGGWLAAYAVLTGRGARRIGSFLTATVLFFIIEACAGGIMTAGFLFLRRTFLHRSFSIDESAPRHMLFWMLAAVVFFLLTAWLRLLSRADANRLAQRGGEVKIRYGEREVCAECLFDSGNLVREPISGKAVVFLPSSFSERLGINTQQLNAGDVCGSRLIPMKTACGVSCGWGIRADEFTYSAENGKFRGSADVYAVFSDAIDRTVVPTSVL